MQAESQSKVESTYQTLFERIRSGHWPIGECLPTEAELAAEFSCGRNTISKAVTRLVHEGLVERKKRAGTRVLRNVTSRGVAPVELDAFAFIFPSEQHEGISRTVAGFQEAAHSGGRRVLTLTTGADYRKDAELIARLPEFDVKGAVIHPVIKSGHDLLEFSQILLRAQLPVVLADVNLPGLGFPTVLSDGMHAAYTVTRYLQSTGLRKIGFLANNSLNHSVRDKYLGYRQAMSEAGLSERHNVLLNPVITPRFENPLQEPIEIARTYLKEHRDLEGVVCVNDFFAHGCLVAAQELKIAVPKDLKVAGINDFQKLPPRIPELTTYHVPFEEIGRAAFQVLCAISEGALIERQETMIRGELIVRESA